MSLGFKLPFLETFKDHVDEREAFQKLKFIVPYKGTNKHSSHSALKMLYFLYKLGASHATCINHIIRNAFCGDVDLIRKGKAGLRYKTNTGELDDTEKVEYVTYLESFGLSIPSITHIVGLAFRHWKISGNAYIHYVEITEGNQVQVRMNIIHPLYAYIIRKKDDLINRSLLMTTSLTRKEGDDKIVNIFPNFTERGKVRETIFHLKNDTGDSYDYGYPDTEHTIRDQQIEVVVRESTCKVANSLLVGKKLMLIKECEAAAVSDKRGDMKKVARSVANSIKPLITTEGSTPSEFAVGGIPYGYTVEIEDLQISREADWDSSKLKESKHNIYAANGCFVEDTGADKASSNMIGNPTNNISDKFDATVVRKYQHMMSNFLCETLNKTLSEASRNEKYLDFRIVFPKSVKNETDDNAIIEDGTNKPE